MSYDFDNCADKLPPRVPLEPMAPDDLEAIVTLIELASVLLTNEPGATFTVEQLIREVMDCGGRELGMKEVDVLNVVTNSHFLKQSGGRLELR